MERYDRAKVGKLIAWSGDHFVYEYGTDDVLKTSNLEHVLGHVGREKSQRDYELCLRYFGTFILPTTFLKSPKGEHIAKVQKRLAGHTLTKGDMSDERIRTQLKEVVVRYEMMKRDGHPPLDFIGTHGLFLPRICNIFLTDEGQLFLIDTTLIELDGIPVLRPLAKVVRWYAERRQDKLLIGFLRQD
jgi:hypothetical protein